MWGVHSQCWTDLETPPKVVSLMDVQLLLLSASLLTLRWEERFVSGRDIEPSVPDRPLFSKSGSLKKTKINHTPIISWMPSLQSWLFCVAFSMTCNPNSIFPEGSVLCGWVLLCCCLQCQLKGLHREAFILLISLKGYSGRWVTPSWSFAACSLSNQSLEKRNIRKVLQ